MQDDQESNGNGEEIDVVAELKVLKKQVKFLTRENNILKERLADPVRTIQPVERTGDRKVVLSLLLMAALTFFTVEFSADNTDSHLNWQVKSNPQSEGLLEIVKNLAIGGVLASGVTAGVIAVRAKVKDSDG